MAAFQTRQTKFKINSSVHLKKRSLQRWAGLLCHILFRIRVGIKSVSISHCCLNWHIEWPSLLNYDLLKDLCDWICDTLVSHINILCTKNSDDPHTPDAGRQRGNSIKIWSPRQLHLDHRWCWRDRKPQNDARISCYFYCITRPNSIYPYSQGRVQPQHKRRIVSTFHSSHISKKVQRKILVHYYVTYP